MRWAQEFKIYFDPVPHFSLGTSGVTFLLRPNPPSPTPTLPTMRRTRTFPRPHRRAEIPHRSRGQQFLGAREEAVRSAVGAVGGRARDG